ncbi:MAG: phospholipid carrier-dependent glycosyltransferase [Candidatus Andersenbacteria bacterium]|nr:phospholipid carrier-dependent glycosyltransferase [Candidatus Andersenbacteria bacterium]MBI3250259.1 phospholipid carrier-dependent glycosyltransferase [Candidatus Andersenbacteria bacterium]
MPLDFKHVSWFQLLLTTGLVFAIILPRFISLGFVYTTDERLWIARGADFIQAFSNFHFADTAIAFQPGVTTAWLAAVTTHFHSLAATQASVAAATSILLLIISYFFVRLFGWQWGMITAYAVAMNPVLIAHSRVIHTDALLALFLLACALSLFYSLDSQLTSSQARRYLIASGILAGLALLTKIFALFAILPLLLILIGKTWQAKRSLKSVAQELGIWIGVAALTVFIVWPALWTHAWGTGMYIWENVTQYSSGRRVGEVSTSWWFYLREIYVRTSIVTTILLPFGILAVVSKWRRQPVFVLLSLLLTSAFYVLLLHTGEDRDVRYLIIFLLTLDIWAVFGLRFIIEFFRGERTHKIVSYTLISAFLLYLGFQTIHLHPYYLAHYNYAYQMPARYKIGWGEGLEQAAMYLAARDPKAEIAVFYASVFEYAWEKYGGVGTVGGSDHLSESTDYLVISRAMFERAPDSIQTELVNRYLSEDSPKPIHTITINGLPYIWIFDVRQQ